MSALMSKKPLRELLCALGLLLAGLGLVLAPGEAMKGAKTGLELCYNVIIPSLFPFFVLSTLVVDLGMASWLGRILEPVMRPLFRVSGACASAVALGFVGGYPVGAKTALNLYKNKLCSKTEAERLLAFCNNSGPAFILGVVGAGVFGDSRIGLLLYLVHALASLLVGLLFRFYGGSESASPRRRGDSRPIAAVRLSAVFTGSVGRSFQSTLSICAFVTFFSVTIQLLTYFGVFSAAAAGLSAVFAPLGLSEEWAMRLLTGLIEISSGVWSLSGTGALAGRASMAAFMLGWAGLSVHCQVLSFLADSGLSTRTYIFGKLLHGGFSAALMALLTRLFPLEQPVAGYLAEQVEAISGLDFSSVLTVSSATAWLVWLLFFAAAALACRDRTSYSGRR